MSKCSPRSEEELQCSLRPVWGQGGWIGKREEACKREESIFRVAHNSFSIEKDGQKALEVNVIHIACSELHSSTPPSGTSSFSVDP